MIGYISGNVMEITPAGVLIENGGIGYEIAVTASALARLSRDRKGGVYTYLQVKEDGISLFGFDTQAEKNMFLKLIGVSGVGCKMAITVLAGLSLQDLATAIATSDYKTLTRIKGCGKKIAERIILELRESVAGMDMGDLPLSAAMAGADDDAVIALMSLGFSRVECDRAITEAKRQGAASVEEIISLSLKSLAK